MIKFDRQGNSNKKFFNWNTMQHEPLYKIEKNGKDWVVFNRQTAMIECASKRRKDCEAEMESCESRFVSEIEKGFGGVE